MILHVVHYTSNNRLDSSKSKTVSKNIFDKLTYFLQLSVLLKKSKITDTSCWLSINIYFHSSVPLCSLSELSITSGMTQASSRWLDLSWVDHAECVCVPFMSEVPQNGNHMGTDPNNSCTSKALAVPPSGSSWGVFNP